MESNRHEDLQSSCRLKERNFRWPKPGVELLSPVRRPAMGQSPVPVESVTPGERLFAPKCL